MAALTFEVESYRALAGEELIRFSRAQSVTLVAALDLAGKGGKARIAAVAPGQRLPENKPLRDGTEMIYVAAAQFPWYLDLLRSEAPVRCVLYPQERRFNGLDAARELVGEGEDLPAPAGPPPDLDAWLAAHAHVHDALRWGGIAYQGWPGAMRAKLRDSFAAALRNEPYAEPPDPPPNVALPNPLSEETRQVLTPADAEAFYLGYAGHCLAREVEGQLPWSIAGWPVDHIRYLLDADEMFRATPEGYEIESRTHGDATPCGVRRAWRFLLDNGLLQRTQLATVGRVLDWCRDNMEHMGGDLTWPNYAAHWRYRGFPPVSRVIDGTQGPNRFAHFTAGCFGTSGFLKVVLRAANIPVRILWKPDVGDAHSLPSFPSIDRYLSHGDDPYTQSVKSALPKFSCEELLLTGARFEALFGSHLDRETQLRNITLRLIELACIYPSLSNMLLLCQDMSLGLDHASGRVFNDWGPDPAMTLEEMEAAGMWTTTERALEAVGGCAALPPLTSV